MLAHGLFRWILICAEIKLIGLSRSDASKLSEDNVKKEWTNARRDNNVPYDSVVIPSSSVIDSLVAVSTRSRAPVEHDKCSCSGPTFDATT